MFLSIEKQHKQVATFQFSTEITPLSFTLVFKKVNEHHGP